MGSDYDLLNAALKRQPKGVRNALKAGADPNYDPSDPRSTPLLQVADASNGGADIIAILIENGADPNRHNGANSPLMLASRAGNLAAVKALLAGGADPDLAVDGGTAIEWAQRMGRREIIAALEQASAAKR